MKKIFLIALISTLLLSIGCKKEKPFVTINGITFGCKINNKQFIPDDWDYGYNIPPLTLRFIADNNNSLDLLLDAEKKNEYVEIYLNHPLTKGRHELKFYTLPFPDADPPKDNGVYAISSQIFITNDNNGGYVDLIEIDTLTHKVYGTFEFIGTDRNTGKQVKVTNGFFKNY